MVFAFGITDCSAYFTTRHLVSRLLYHDVLIVDQLSRIHFQQHRVMDPIFHDVHHLNICVSVVPHVTHVNFCLPRNIYK
ncbi:unnamed protein product [Schistosoma margrebowiei]|uniref:Uncharacterized protein n=1 Tax=Schistosoma margrebowiei TaxID=48269 RepID=A0A183MB38_9TREM|nr:unnamed protein product [Schistosoma margrebowiei]